MLAVICFVFHVDFRIRTGGSRPASRRHFLCQATKKTKQKKWPFYWGRVLPELCGAGGGQMNRKRIASLLQPGAKGPGSQAHTG
jgi:hypothetical protein